jgi:hypothetical protein
LVSARGAQRRTVNWSNGGTAKKVGSGWNFRQVFAADDGVIYAINNAGDLLWYQHLGRSDGAATWSNGGTAKKVGSGWNFRQVFAASDAVVYAIV